MHFAATAKVDIAVSITLSSQPETTILFV